MTLGTRSAPRRRGHGLKRRRTPKAFAHRRDPAYAAWIRQQPCLLALQFVHICHGTVQACHVKSRGAGGDDRANLWPGCAGAHDEQHRIGIRSFQARWNVDLPAVAAELDQRYLAETGA